jgi:uncharacterized protein (TIGR02246 family)
MTASDVEKAIEKLVATMLEGWNEHNAQHFASVFAADADFTNVFGMLLTGRAAVEAAHHPIFTGMYKDSHLAATGMRVRVVRPDGAVAELRWNMTGARDPFGKEWPARQGLMDLVATRESDGWSIAIFHNMDLPSPEKLQSLQAALKQ